MDANKENSNKVNHYNMTSKNALKQVENICRDTGVKLTNIRYKVLELIWQSPKHPIKAYDILDKLKEYNISAKPPTVYRALDFLLKHKFIHKIQSLNSYIACSHPLENHLCYFLICDSCGKIDECCNQELTSAINHTTTTNNFNLDQVAVEIRGKCTTCI